MSRFRYAADPLCLLACAAYALNRFWLKSAIPSEVLHSWFNDFWLIPAALPPVLWVQRKLGVRAGDGVPTVWEIVMHLVTWALICEGLGPLLVPGRMGDWGDVGAYAAGAVAAGVWWHRGRLLRRRRADVAARV